MQRSILGEKLCDMFSRKRVKIPTTATPLERKQLGEGMTEQIHRIEITDCHYRIDTYCGRDGKETFNDAEVTCKACKKIIVSRSTETED